MTTSSNDVQVGEIWLAYLHFSDKPDVGKVRPVLIVRANADAALAVALKVTSKNPQDGRRSMPIVDWESCGLRRPSYVRLDQLFEIATDSLLRERPLGTLKPAQLASIMRAMESA